MGIVDPIKPGADLESFLRWIVRRRRLARSWHHLST
jgi:hypothetical protein